MSAHRPNSDARCPEDSQADADQGSIHVVSPLGASLAVRVGSLEEDVCTDWHLLHSGRGALCPTNPVDWFDSETLHLMPRWLLAELLASASRMEDFFLLLKEDSEARAHMLRLPASMLEADPEHKDHVADCVDLARRCEARAAAESAAQQVRSRLD
jgi:hypothetical protein